MTASLARLGVPAPDGYRFPILCSLCPEIIAWGSVNFPDRVMAPGSLTDRGTPGVYRWPQTALKRMAQGRLPDYDRHLPDELKGWRGQARVILLPILEIPCRRHHVSAVDGRLFEL